jgi:hypothetical protein
MDVVLFENRERLFAADGLASEAVVQTLLEIVEAADQRLFTLVQVQVLCFFSREFRPDERLPVVLVGDVHAKVFCFQVLAYLLQVDCLGILECVLNEVKNGAFHFFVELEKTVRGLVDRG